MKTATMRTFRNGLPKVRTVAPVKTTVTATKSSTGNNNSFTTALRDFEKVQNNSTCYSFGKCVTSSVLRKIEQASGNETIRTLRNEYYVDMAIANNSEKFSDTYNDSIDLVHTAIVVGLEQLKLLSGTDTLETKRTEKQLSKHVLINTDTVAYKDVQTCGITETYRAVRRAIDNSRHVSLDPTSKYCYIADTVKGDNLTDAEKLETIYHRLPACYQLATINAFGITADNYTGNVVTNEKGEKIAITYESILSQLNLTAKQATILKYRLQGYGYDSIATAIGVKKDTVRDCIEAIQDKFSKLYPELSEKYISRVEREKKEAEKRVKSAKMAVRRATEKVDKLKKNISLAFGINTDGNYCELPAKERALLDACYFDHECKVNVLEKAKAQLEAVQKAARNEKRTVSKNSNKYKEAVAKAEREAKKEAVKASLEATKTDEKMHNDYIESVASYNAMHIDHEHITIVPVQTKQPKPSLRECKYSNTELALLEKRKANSKKAKNPYENEIWYRTAIDVSNRDIALNRVRKAAIKKAVAENVIRRMIKKADSINDLGFSRLCKYADKYGINF